MVSGQLGDAIGEPKADRCSRVVVHGCSMGSLSLSGWVYPRAGGNLVECADR